MISGNLEICGGCHTNRSACGVRDIAGTHIKPNKYVPEGMNCPCSICLVKMMCEVKCDLLLDYYEVHSFCSNPSRERVFVKYVVGKFKRSHDYPPLIKQAMKPIVQEVSND